MAGEAHDHAQILASAQRSLSENRAGGRRKGAIGKRSVALRRAHVTAKLVRMALAIAAILIAVTVAGVVIGGIGIGGLALTVLAIIAAVGLFGTFPRFAIPQPGALNRGDPLAMVGRTQLWLESQRPALPAPAARQLDTIGLQLDALGQQLAGLDPAEPAVREIRRLVGEHLPEMVASYRRIPEHLRREEQAGRSADATLTEGLGTISREIDEIARQLAQGDLDALAVKERFLDYRYGHGLEDSPALLSSGGETTRKA